VADGLPLAQCGEYQTDKMDDNSQLKVETSRLHERVYESLRRALLQGAFAPGRVLTIRELARDIGTSMQPVRDALARLTSEGALEQLPNRSIRVPPLTRRSFEELYELRKLLEGEAAAKAAKNMTPEDIEQLQLTFDEMDLAIDGLDNEGYLSANQKFHFCIYRAAESPGLMLFIESLWLRAGPLMRLIPEKFPMIEKRSKEAQRHHELLFQALKNGNAEMARLALHGDLDSAADAFRKNYSFSNQSLKNDQKAAAN